MKSLPDSAYILAERRHGLELKLTWPRTARSLVVACQSELWQEKRHIWTGLTAECGNMVTRLILKPIRPFSQEPSVSILWPWHAQKPSSPISSYMDLPCKIT